MSDERSDADLTALGSQHARLVSLALPDDGALATLSRLTDLALVTLRTGSQAWAAARKPRHQPGTLHEAVSRQKRDARLDKLLADMATASASERVLIIGQALALHPPAAERRAFRKSAIRTLYRVHYEGLPVRQASRLIFEDLKHRLGGNIRSTGNPGKDQLCDRIVLTGLPTSAETIRQLL
uniref:Uncharacterized protein n=1 Tax=Bosea sp. NBC_00436 TaxID=2969620 RepID=A0A9E8CLH9_9HYPH